MGAQVAQELFSAAQLSSPFPAMAKAMVLRGTKAKTSGGLTAKDLTRSKYGKIVSKKRSAVSKKSPWIAAVKKARAALKIKGFCAIKKGSPLYLKAKEFFKN